MEFFVNGFGAAATSDVKFRYVSKWSDDSTWGGEFAPMFNESVWVPPGLNLLVDVDRVPMLNLVLVEGSIIFAPDSDPNHERFFDANFIFVRNGDMEVGTEEFPYTSKITITMHGSVSSPYIPIYGNKVIGVRHGNLDMHGVKREPTWTVLERTVSAGDSQITLNEAVDWKVGESIAIASTSYDGREADQRMITAIDRTNVNKPILTLDSPLRYDHFAETQTFDSAGLHVMETRAEVGLINRNVVFRGDPETSA
jgi:hypothetical protein